MDRISHLLTLLGNPQNKFKSIQVSGTSGKGSTSFITASILHQAGYKVGLHLSPHLQKVTERFQINGQLMSDKVFISYVNRLVPFIDEVETTDPTGKPSYFEVLVAIAFLYFSENQVDYAVIEVGLGGRLDATNVLHPEVGIITNIGLDHEEWLGDTVEKIAAEKAGIIKPGMTIVTGVTQESVIEIVRSKCKFKNSKILEFNRDFGARKQESSTQKTENNIVEVDLSSQQSIVNSQLPAFDYWFGSNKITNLSLSLLGDFQITNAALAITVVKNLPGIQVSDANIRQALKQLYFPGRLEIIEHNGQTLIIDGAHNPMKMGALVSSLKRFFPCQKFTVILAIKKDKDYQSMIDSLIPMTDKFMVTEFHRSTDTGNNLSRSASDLSNYILDKNLGIGVQVLPNCQEALNSLNQKDLILVTGSLYLVGEVRNLLRL